MCHLPVSFASCLTVRMHSTVHWCATWVAHHRIPSIWERRGSHLWQFPSASSRGRMRWCLWMDGWMDGLRGWRGWWWKEIKSWDASPKWRVSAICPTILNRADFKVRSWSRHLPKSKSRLYRGPTDNELTERCLWVPDYAACPKTMRQSVRTYTMCIIPARLIIILS